jgi:hypothetical protein
MVHFYLLPNPALYYLGIQFAPEVLPEGGIYIIPRGSENPRIGKN